MGTSAQNCLQGPGRGGDTLRCQALQVQPPLLHRIRGRGPGQGLLQVPLSLGDGECPVTWVTRSAPSAPPRLAQL